MYHLIYDLIIVAVLLLAVWRGYCRGFVLALCGFLAIFVALIGASFVSDILAQPVADMIQPVVEDQLSEIVQSQTQSLQNQLDLEELDLEQLDLPLDQILELLQDSAIYRSLAGAFQAAVDAGVVEVTTSAARSLADFIALQIARAALFLLTFVVVLVVWFFISHALDLAFKLPVLSTLNHWAGAGVGLLKGVLLVFIACWLLRDGFLPPDAVENSYLLRLFCTTSPLEFLG